MSKIVETFLPDENSLLELGAQLAQHTSPPCVIFLIGQLGAGKTTLVRGFLRGLGYQGKVKSPTYNLVEGYEFEDKSLFHFDFYRIQDPRELDFMGIQDYWRPSAIFLIEWPDKAAKLLPPADLVCSLEVLEQGRQLRLEAKSEAGERVLLGSWR